MDNFLGYKETGQCKFWVVIALTHWAVLLNCISSTGYSVVKVLVAMNEVVENGLSMSKRIKSSVNFMIQSCCWNSRGNFT